LTLPSASPSLTHTLYPIRPPTYLRTIDFASLIVLAYFVNDSVWIKYRMSLSVVCVLRPEFTLARKRTKGQHCFEKKRKKTKTTETRLCDATIFLKKEISKVIHEKKGKKVHSKYDSSLLSHYSPTADSLAIQRLISHCKEEFGLSRVALAKEVGVAAKTLAYWSTGQIRAGEEQRRRVEAAVARLESRHT
jgi:ribosome-binding protein aMBF1 (putative translation factor)